MPYPQTSGKGAPGNPGAPGTGVSGSSVTYQVGADGNSVPTGSWSAAVPVVPKGQYLWTRTITNFTNNTSTTAYSVAYSAIDGAPGSPGAPGNPGTPGNPGVDGVGMSSSTIMYAAAANATTPPSSGWSSSMPAVNKGQYLWTRTTTAYTNGTSTTAYSLGYVALDGAPGTQGAPGSPGSAGTPGTNGVGVASSTVTYQASSSGTTAPTGAWSSTVPVVSKGQYLWTRTILTMTDSSSSTAYAVSYIGADGTPGAPGSPGAAGVSYNPQPPVSRTVTVATAYQHTDTAKPYKVQVNARATQTVTLAGTVADRIELRVGPTAASVAPGGSGGFSVGVWESGITGIAVMIGAAVQDGGQVTADVPAGWYFQVNRLAGTSATIVSCFTQAMTA